jgi:hypothetical protein
MKKVTIASLLQAEEPVYDIFDDKDAAMLQILLEIIDGDDKSLIGKAAYAIGMLKPTVSLKAMPSPCQHDQQIVRVAVAGAIFKSKYSGQFDPSVLSKLIEDEDIGVAKYAVKASTNYLQSDQVKSSLKQVIQQKPSIFLATLAKDVMDSE